jgi:hypothetical protein
VTCLVRVPEGARTAALAAGFRNEFDGCWPDKRANPPDFGPEWVGGRFEDIETG